MIRQFRAVVSQQRTSVLSATRRMSTALEQLLQAGQSVKQLRKERKEAEDAQISHNMRTQEVEIALEAAPEGEEGEEAAAEAAEDGEEGATGARAALLEEQTQLAQRQAQVDSDVETARLRERRAEALMEELEPHKRDWTARVSLDGGATYALNVVPTLAEAGSGMPY